MEEKKTSKVDQVKEFTKKHWKEILLGVTVIGGTVIAIKCGKKSSISDTEIQGRIEDISDELSGIDFGRNCILKAYVEETGEELEGSIPCTELFFREML